MPAGAKPGWMLVSRPAWAFLVLALLMSPGAAAFSTREEPLRVAYDLDATPVVLAIGELHAEGELRGGYVAAEVYDLALRAVPELTVTESENGSAPANATHRGATLVVHAGSVLWTFGDAGRLGVEMEAPYGIGVALPHLPVSPAEEAGAGLLVAAPDLSSDLSWTGSEGRLVVLDGEASLLDAKGVPLPGWDRRAVNPGAGPGDDPTAMRTFFTVSGAFQGVSRAGIQGGALGASQDLSLSARPSGLDRFEETLDVLSGATGLLGDDGADAFGRDSPVRQLGAFSSMFDGALLLLGDTPGEDGEAVSPVESRLGDAEFEVGPLALVRGDPMSLAWADGQMAVQGTPVVAITSAGFAVDEPATLAGLVPILSLVLWAVALAAIVVFFVKRPQGEKGSLLLRLVSLAVHVVVLVAVFLWWDASFAQTFGTSVVTLFRAGTALSDPLRLSLLASIELAPWGLAALLFALPVRIALGVGLRYLGKGKTFKGVAKAGGLVALGIFGPVYALWIVNVLVAEALDLIPGMMG